MASIATGATPERTGRVMFLAAVILAAIASVLVYVALQDQGGGEASPVVAETASVVVMARDVPANITLTEEMLDVQSIPVEAVLDGTYATADALVGLPTRFPMAKGEQLTPLKVGLDAIADEKDIALLLPAGTRGFAVEVSEITGVGGLLLPGNVVDVIAFFDERQTGVDKVVTLLQNLQVVSVAQEAQEPIPAYAASNDDGAAVAGILAQRPDDVERQPGARTVTLAVTPSQAQMLVLAQEKGTIWLALRPLDDEEINFLTETTLEPYETAAQGGN